MSIEDQEREKYRSMWDFPEYRQNAPGERLVDEAINRMGMKPPSRVIDFGCGTGRAAQAFKRKGFSVVGIDIADNCLDEGVDVPLFVHTLWEPLGMAAEYGFCTDVMEHIPPDKVDAVLDVIACSVDGCYFQIATFPDGMGRLIGDTLHLTVEDAEWWRGKLTAHFDSVEIEGRGNNVIAICRS